MSDEKTYVVKVYLSAVLNLTVAPNDPAFKQAVEENVAEIVSLATEHNGLEDLIDKTELLSVENERGESVEEEEYYMPSWAFETPRVGCMPEGVKL